MTDPDLGPVLRHVARRDAPATALCFDDDTIAVLAEGALDDVTRTTVMPHLAECARCRAAVASVSRALSQPPVATEIARLRGRGRRLFQIAIPVAAAAIILLVMVPSGNNDVAPVHRSPTITAVSSPVLLSPVGIVANAEALRWHGVSGADRYRATLFDDAGAVLYETQTLDTTVALPETLPLKAGRSYLWKVEARMGWGRWSASELVEFSIR